MKKSGYKYQIKQELLKSDWEVISIDSNEEWWEDEHWKVVFKYDPNLSFYLCFIVDPSFEGQRKPGQGIYEIKVSTELLKGRNDNSNEITSISMTKRKFDIKLKEFIEEIEKFKKEKTTANKS